MILVALEIEDYKQFAGTHRFTPAQEGIVAIIGHNGAGKTTLFEAIEWCLYQPREIASDEVAPRGQVARPRVTLTLMDPENGNRYVIARWLSKSRVADAEIYREDAPESRIVKGSRQVTDYVSRTLVGLSHRAFVSTFFTRQKELTFFGDLKETDRRREVGRLLGMETIREAQKLIGDERTEMANRARALELQHKESTEGRDFVLEADSAERIVEARSRETESAADSLTKAEQAHVAVRAEMEALTLLERQEAEIRRQLERIEGDMRAAQEKRAGATAALQRIDAVALERPSLATTAADHDRRRIVLSAFELAREQFQSRQRLETELLRAQSAATNTVAELKAVVQRTSTPSLPAWRWSDHDDPAPLPAFERLIAVGSGLDISSANQRLTALESITRLSVEHAKAEQSLQTMRTLLEKLTSELAGIRASGDPGKLADTLTREREGTLKRVHESGSRLNAIADEVARLEPVRARLGAQETGSICPTCGRPIEAEDIAVTLALFASQIDALQKERQLLERERPIWLDRIAQIEKELEVLRKRASDIETLNVRIENGRLRITETEIEVASKTSEIESLQSRYSVAVIPTAELVASESRALDSLRRVDGSLALLRRLSSTLREAIDLDIELSAELSAIGPISYDAVAHKQAQEEVSEADRASARLAQIDALLAQRPERLAEIQIAEQEIGVLTVNRDQQRELQWNLGFDPARLESTRASEQSALHLERMARDQLAAATTARFQAISARDSLLEEHRRIQRLIERSESSAREAGQLDLMYREFNAFEQYVADRLTPQLSEYTSDLLRAITDGKYDQVWFSSNYGIEVFDGDEEHFPVDEFSGGERDVIALCARLALSRLIGAQANNPPGFMVLDEVFGSLDRDRRAQVLETLGALAGSEEAFHQLFIISHVDDVRSSPIFNEVWRVSEGANGISSLENLNLTGGFDEN